MTDILLVRVNCPSETIAAEIAEAAITAGLAACANIEGPVRAIYPWQGRIERDAEWVLWLKVRKTGWERTEALVLSKHPHDIPAILGLACTHAHAPFAEWVASTVKA